VPNHTWGWMTLLEVLCILEEVRWVANGARIMTVFPSDVNLRGTFSRNLHTFGHQRSTSMLLFSSIILSIASCMASLERNIGLQG
jgi:hypothetical protein